MLRYNSENKRYTDFDPPKYYKVGNIRERASKGLLKVLYNEDAIRWAWPQTYLGKISETIGGSDSKYSALFYVNSSALERILNERSPEFLPAEDDIMCAVEKNDEQITPVVSWETLQIAS